MNFATRNWPRPLRLLTVVLGHPETDLDPTLRTMTASDWQNFLHLSVERHRVASMVMARIDQIDPPKEVRDVLTQSSQANAMRVLGQLAALQAVKRSFEDRNIEFAVLKGLPLAEQLYGTSSARIARDIDLLIEPHNVIQASEQLADLGFQPDPRLRSLIGASSLIAETSDLTFTHPDNDVMIEMHWRCHQFTGWPEVFEGRQNLERIDTSIGKLTVPDQQSNLIYLSIHGSMHRWSRLKWLLDIAALAERRGANMLEQDLMAAEAMGAARSVELGLTLSNWLFGSPCPETRYAETSWLPRQCLREISRSEAVPDSFAQRMKFYAMMFAIADDLSQRLGVLRYRLWGKNRLSLANLWRTA